MSKFNSQVRYPGLRRPISIGLMLVLFGLAGIPGAVFAEGGASLATAVRHVLILNSHDHGMPWQHAVNQSIAERFDKEPGFRVKFHTEFTGLSQHDSNGYARKLLDLYRYKYAGVTFDLLFAVDIAATNFIAANRPALFPGVPVVFISEKGSGLTVRPGDHMTGILDEVDVKGTLDMALGLHPGTRRVAVISGVSEMDRQFERVARDVFKSYADRLEFVYLNHLAMPDLLAAVGRLPEDTIALYVLTLVDAAGERFIPKRILPRISRASSVPVYGLWDTFLGSGIVGGSLSSAAIAGEKLSGIGLRILKGEKPENIPVTTGFNAYLLDWQQLRRWRIPESDLPAGSVIRFKQYSFWALYKWHILAVIALVVFQGLLICVLFVQHVRLRAAERSLTTAKETLEKQVAQQTAELRESNRLLIDSEERFRSLSDASFEGILFSENGIVIDLNKALSQMTGYAPAEVIGRSVMDFLPREDRAEAARKMLVDYEKHYETRCIRKDGTVFPVGVRGRTFLYKGKSIRVSAIQDLTETKTAETVLMEKERMQGVLEMAGAVCHEINQPLMAIMGYAQLLLGSFDGHEQARERIITIIRQIERLRNLSDKLMRITRYETRPYLDSKIIDIEKSSDKASRKPYKE